MDAAVLALSGIVSSEGCGFNLQGHGETTAEAHRMAVVLRHYTDIMTESHQIRTMLGEDVTYLTPSPSRPERTPEEREAARQRVMRHVTE